MLYFKATGKGLWTMLSPETAYEGKWKSQQGHFSSNEIFKDMLMTHIGQMRVTCLYISKSISIMLKFRGPQLFIYWSVSHCYFFSNYKGKSNLLNDLHLHCVRIQFFFMNMMISWKKEDRLFMPNITLVWFFLVLLWFAMVHIVLLSVCSKNHVTRRES